MGIRKLLKIISTIKCLRNIKPMKFFSFYALILKVFTSYKSLKKSWCKMKYVFSLYKNKKNSLGV